MEKGFQTSIVKETGADELKLSQFHEDLNFIESVFRPHRPKMKPVPEKHLTDRYIEHSSKFKNIVLAMIQKDIPLSNDHLFFRAFLQEYNLKVNFDPKVYFQDGDIIEVYDETMSQIFRNETFYKFCSYGLDEIILHPFHYLYRRDPKIDAILMKNVRDCFENIDTIRPLDCEPHTMQEQFAGNSTVFKIQHKFIAPVYSQTTGKKLAFMVTQRADRIGDSNIRGIGFVS
jgi:hypothetical protein